MGLTSCFTTWQLTQMALDVLLVLQKQQLLCLSIRLLITCFPAVCRHPTGMMVLTGFWCCATLLIQLAQVGTGAVAPLSHAAGAIQQRACQSLVNGVEGNYMMLRATINASYCSNCAPSGVRSASGYSRGDCAAAALAVRYKCGHHVGAM